MRQGGVRSAVNSAIARALEHAADRLGYAVIPKWRLRSLPLVQALQRLFADNRIETVIDVGANLGQFHDFLRHQVGFAGRIESFEPTPELAAKLKEKAATDPNWTIHACALGSEAGSMKLNLMKLSVFNSFRVPVPRPGLDDNVIVNHIDVRVCTLNAIFGEREDLDRTYLKIDAQGFDLEILKGGDAVASKIPALQTEISFASIYDGVPGYARSIEAFEEHGFAVKDLFLVVADSRGVALEFDCIMIRPSAR